MPISIVTTFQSSWKFRPWNRSSGSARQWTSHRKKIQIEDSVSWLTGYDLNASIMVLIWSETFLWYTNTHRDVRTTLSCDGWIVWSAVSQRVVAGDGKVEASLIDSCHVAVERHRGWWAEQVGIKQLKNVCMKTSKVTKESWRCVSGQRTTDNLS